jgi:hypothetical protein
MPYQRYWQISLLLLGLTTSVPAADYRVNGHLLNPAEIETLRFVAQSVFSALPGDDSVELVARATWWSLREAVISDWNFARLRRAKQNLHSFSLCSRPTSISCSGNPVSEPRKGDCLIGPLETCDRGKAWQVGAAAVQVYTTPGNWQAQQKRIERWIARCWNGSKTDKQVIEEAVKLAQLPERDAQEVNRLPPGPLRNSWLLRHPVIGMAIVVEQEVTPECFPPVGPATRPQHCFKRTPQGELYARTPETAAASLEDLRRIYRDLAAGAR